MPQAPTEALLASKIADRRGFTSRLLQERKDVTAKNVTGHLRKFLEPKTPVDLFISFAGHGMQRMLRKGEPPGPCPEDSAGAEEFWVLDRSVLCDNTLANLWASLPAESRVLVVADCCHSGGSFFEPFALVAPRLVERLRVRAQSDVKLNDDATEPCPDLIQPDPKRIDASIVGLASSTSDDITKPGLISALDAALRNNPANYAEWVKETDEILRTIPDGPKKVVPCRFGMAADEMWNGRPLA